jgi:hypothetical protein
LRKWGSSSLLYAWFFKIHACFFKNCAQEMTSTRRKMEPARGKAQGVRGPRKSCAAHKIPRAISGEPRVVAEIRAQRRDQHACPEHFMREWKFSTHGLRRARVPGKIRAQVGAGCAQKAAVARGRRRTTRIFSDPCAGEQRARVGSPAHARWKKSVRSGTEIARESISFTRGGRSTTCEKFPITFS